MRLLHYQVSKHLGVELACLCTETDVFANASLGSCFENEIERQRGNHTPL